MSCLLLCERRKGTGEQGDNTMFGLLADDNQMRFGHRKKHRSLMSLPTDPHARGSLVSLPTEPQTFVPWRTRGVISVGCSRSWFKTCGGSIEPLWAALGQVNTGVTKSWEGVWALPDKRSQRHNKTTQAQNQSWINHSLNYLCTFTLYNALHSGITETVVSPEIRVWRDTDNEK